MARTKPPPAATPLTAAMTGLLTCSRKLNSAGSSSSSGSGVAASRRITLGRAGQVGGVEPGAEAPPLAGEDDGHHVGIGRRPLHGGADLLDHHEREGVQLLRPVEADDAERAVDGVRDVRAIPHGVDAGTLGGDPSKGPAELVYPVGRNRAKSRQYDSRDGVGFFEGEDAVPVVAQLEQHLLGVLAGLGDGGARLPTAWPRSRPAWPPRGRRRPRARSSGRPGPAGRR